MTQKYKAVYFPDFPADTSQQKSLTLAFGKKSSDLYKYVKDLSSTELRQLLGYDSYEDILDAATGQDLPVNTYCIRQLKSSLTRIREQEYSQLAFKNLSPRPQLFDPVTVTFRGGAKEPFVRWYPYLEGYSPQFVNTIFEKYAPKAKVVLDPFAGTGTTIFTASQMNKFAYYCEVNPVLQFVCLTKITVRRMPLSQRKQLAYDLRLQSNSLTKLRNFTEDYQLKHSYQLTFINSTFFDEQTFEHILRIRTWIDNVATENTVLANLITIAVLAALIPSSKMKRAGDLRYKTEKEARTQTTNLLDEIDKNIKQIIQDVQSDINGLITEPLLVCEDAQSLANIPRLELDTVITSPPYVNGTNYFRNTKIELWFLRSLTKNEDLARFRAKTLTAGINDVTKAKKCIDSHPEVEKIVSKLQENAYDSRIPKMIACYFSELTGVFQAIRNHLTINATLAIDIGDSCYAGVHVPADQLLSYCLQDLGFNQIDGVNLRQRKSRSGGMTLKQSLLVFKYAPKDSHFYIKKFILPWKVKWDEFKENLPHQKEPYSKRNWGNSLHSLCSYPGKLKPAIAHHLVKTFVPDNGKVLDPFAGVGTIPLEAALQGKLAYGFELSPAAYIIARGKAQIMSKDRCSNIIQNLHTYLSQSTCTQEEFVKASEFGFNGKLPEYYEQKTLEEILLARRYFQINPPELPEDFFVLASLLHILHGNRPYALSRRSHPITPYKPTGNFEYRALIERLQAKVDRGLKQVMPNEFKPSKLFLQDATSWWPREIDELDAVITSPPFFDSTRYYLANWLRLWFAGWSQQDFKSRPLGFVDERQKKSFDVYIPILRQARERLKPNGVVVFHLGKSVKCNMAEQLIQLGKKWFRSFDIFDESVSHCESHGIRDKGTVTSHQYLILY